MNELSSAGKSVNISWTGTSSLGLLLWVAVQLGGLGLAAGRVPLYAEYPQPGELHAIVILTAVQWLAVGLIFPVLWSNWRGVVWVIGSGVVMLFFAGALSAASIGDIFVVASYFSLFVACIFVWSEVVGGLRSKMILVAVVGCVNQGGVLLAYLRQDLGGGVGGGGKWKYGALWPVLKDPQNPAEFGWILLIFVLAVGCLIRLMQWRRHLRRETKAR